MAIIKKLDELTINQIAAGEVVESPSSALKEIVENAIDAGANSIEVEIKGGGFQLLRVTDNGMGMSEEDAELCLQRHATSKMHTVLDLNSILSMGFRGEALSSIASVSELEIRTSDGKEGTSLMVSYGEICQKHSLDLRKGTSIFIKNLFLNVPARKKFQKSKTASCNEIHKLMKQFLIAYPEIQFRFINEDVEVFHEGAGTFEERVQSVFDPEMQPRLPLHYQKDSWKLHGLVGSPSQVRPTRSGQYFFLNKRMIVAPEVSFAVGDGFGIRIDKGKFPIFILHLSIPPKDVDVNVHPQKKHVRFQDPLKIKAFVRGAIEQLFLKGMNVPKPSFTFELEDSLAKKQTSAWFFEESKYEGPIEKSRGQKSFGQTITGNKPPMQAMLDQSPFERELLEKSPFPEKPLRQKEEDFFRNSPLIHSFGIFDGYLLVHSETLANTLQGMGDKEAELICFHLKRAQQRVFFEKSLNHYLKHSSGQQKTIEPLEWKVTKEEAESIEANNAFFQAMGFDLKRFGPTSFLIEAYEDLWPRSELLSICNEILKSCPMDIGKEKIDETVWLKRISKLLKKISKKYWTKVEAEYVVSELLKTKNPYISPLGEKTFARLKGQDIEKRF